MEIARFKAVMDLPSLGMQLVRQMVFMGFSAAQN
jgi:hypothetical protein